MTTPAGTISLNDVNVELIRSGTATIDMNDSQVRTLAGAGGSGTTIDMDSLRGKSWVITLSTVGTVGLDPDVNLGENYVGWVGSASTYFPTTCGSASTSSYRGVTVKSIASTYYYTYDETYTWFYEDTWVVVSGDPGAGWLATLDVDGSTWSPQSTDVFGGNRVWVFNTTTEHLVDGVKVKLLA